MPSLEDILSLKIFAAKRKTCQACGAEFDCAMLSGRCWCGEVKLNREQASDLKSRYSDCLCPNCLNEAARNGAPSSFDQLP
jgi:hypothetical protein